MSSVNKQFELKALFEIIYSHKYRMYDFTVLDLETKEVIYHYHFKSLKEINKLIQEYK